jgi:glycosyltransferase involved in cell wall biosynthesis
VAQPLEAGVPRAAASLVADQVRRGLDVSVACPARSELRRLAREAGARALCWEATRSPGPAVPRETLALARLVSAAGPDLVHLHSAKAGLAGRAAVRGRRATVFQPHAWSFEVSGPQRAPALRWERFAARRWTDLVLCVSEAERRRAEEAGVRARFATVPNGIDLGRHPPAGKAERRRARERLGLGDGPLALAVGRLSEQKGQDVLLSAWPAVLRHVPEAELVLVGDGPARAALEARGAPRVRFEGARSDVHDWLAAADVVAMPSRWEGLSLVMLEAMASARSVVSSDVAGAREAIGDAGAIVPTDAPAPLADALAERLADPALAGREGVAGRRRVERDFDLNRVTARVAELYGEVMERRR